MSRVHSARADGVSHRCSYTTLKASSPAELHDIDPESRMPGDATSRDDFQESGQGASSLEGAGPGDLGGDAQLSRGRHPIVSILRSECSP